MKIIFSLYLLFPVCQEAFLEIAEKYYFWQICLKRSNEVCLRYFLSTNFLTRFLKRVKDIVFFFLPLRGKRSLHSLSCIGYRVSCIKEGVDPWFYQSML